MISKIEMNLNSYIRKNNFLEVVDMQHLTPPFFYYLLGERAEVGYLKTFYFDNNTLRYRQRLFSGIQTL